MVVHSGRSSPNNLKRMNFMLSHNFLCGEDDSRKRTPSMGVVLMRAVDSLKNEKLASPDNQFGRSPRLYLKSAL